MELVINILNGITNYDYSDIVFVWEAIAFPICVALILGIYYSVSKTIKIHKTSHAIQAGAENTVAPAPVKSPVEKARTVNEWQNILAKARSEDENERKFAIIAADTLIDKILALAGYQGENLGERLKKIESSDLDSLNDLWEAHKIRNKIAHEAGFRLYPEETMRAISRYEMALRELEYI